MATVATVAALVARAADAGSQSFVCERVCREAATHIAKSIRGAADDDAEEGEHTEQLGERSLIAQRPRAAAVGATGAAAIHKPLGLRSAIIPP